MVVQPVSGPCFKGIKTDNGIAEKAALVLALSGCAALGLKNIQLPSALLAADGAIGGGGASDDEKKAPTVMDLLLSMLQTTQVCVCSLRLFH